MLNHRHKRILIRGLLVKEMNFICPDAPSGCQNPWEFPKGITFSPDISHFGRARLLPSHLRDGTPAPQERRPTLHSVRRLRRV